LKNLSGAEIARVDIAATLAADPDVVVIDDAFAGLDAESLRLVMSLLRAHASSGVPVVLATNDWEAAQTFADDVISLSQGKVTAPGNVEKLLGGPRYRIETDDAEAARSALESRRGISAVTVADGDDKVISFRADDAKTAAAGVAAIDGLKNFESVRPTLAEQYKEAL